MGTHPNAPSVLYNEPLASLSSLVSSDPKHFLGDQVARKFEGNFPFLFKVLSVNKGKFAESLRKKTDFPTV